MCYSGLSNPKEFSFTSDEETSEQTIRSQASELDTLKKLYTDSKTMHVLQLNPSLEHRLQ